MSDDVLSVFYEIVRKDPGVKRSVLSREKLADIFTECVSKIKHFYHEAKYVPQDEYTDTVKVYLRLYKPTGHYYIGYTRQDSSVRRHRQDLCESSSQRQHSRLFEFYRCVLDTDDNFEDNFLIFVLTEVDSVATAKKLEEDLIYHFTNPANDTGLPIELCLNTEKVYLVPVVSENTPRKQMKPNIIDLSSVSMLDIRKSLKNEVSYVCP